MLTGPNDCESLYNLVNGRHPVHAFFHSYLGATLIIPATVGLFLLARWLAARIWLPDLFRWKALKPRQVLAGAALGAWSHVLLDSVMHADIAPLWPFSTHNALLAIISLDKLHLACLAAGLVAALILAARRSARG